MFFKRELDPRLEGYTEFSYALNKKMQKQLNRLTRRISRSKLNDSEYYFYLQRFKDMMKDVAGVYAVALTSSGLANSVGQIELVGNYARKSFEVTGAAIIYILVGDILLKMSTDMSSTLKNYYKKKYEKQRIRRLFRKARTERRKLQGRWVKKGFIRENEIEESVFGTKVV